MRPLFEIVFEDKTAYSGGDYIETKWKEIPNKKISSIFYLLPSGDYLALAGYDKYYHMIEVTQDFYGSKDNKVNFEYAYIMGKKDNIVKIYKISLKQASIEIKLLEADSDFIKKLNSDYWR